MSDEDDEFPSAGFRGSPMTEPGFSEFSQVVESIGKLSFDLNLSQEKWGRGVEV